MRRLVVAAGLCSVWRPSATASSTCCCSGGKSWRIGWFPLLAVGTNLAYLLLATPLGVLADRIGRLQVVLGGYAALVLVYLLLFGPVGGWPLLVLVLALYGLFYAATDGVLMALAGPVLPAALRTTGIALIQTGQALAYLVSSVLFGLAWTVWGPAGATRIAAALVAVAVLADGPAAARHPCRRRSRRDAPGAGRRSSAALLLAAVAVGYGAFAVTRDHAPVAAATNGLSLTGGPRILFRSTAPDSKGHLALVAKDHPDGPRSVSTLSCLRVYAAGGTGACLRPDGALSTYQVAILDANLQVRAGDSAGRRAEPHPGVRRRAHGRLDGVRCRGLLQPRTVLHPGRT